MEADGRLRFTLDGQCATVDDYLEVRPDAEPLIRRLVAEGRLAIGPWQILMDEFLVSGETLVRNLELGWARATELGGAMRVGYLPDMFGHVAQMPQILRRAGIDRAVVWRGVPAVIDRNTFAWESPDGSVVEAEYLVGGYGNGAHLFDVPGRLKAKLAEHVDANEPFYGRHSILAMYGTDHAVPSPRLADLVDAINADDSPVVVRLETLAEYAARTDIEPSGGAGAHWTRRAPLRGPREHADERHVRAGRREDRRGARRTTARALRGATDGPARDGVAGTTARACLAAAGGQLRPRFDLRLLPRRRRRAGPDQVRGGGADRARRAVARARRDREPGPDRQLGRDQPVARPARGLRGVRRRGPAGMGVGRAALRRSPDLIAGMRPRRPGRRRPQAPRFGDPELFRRRRHGRELFGRQINSIDIQPDHPDGTPTVRVFADDIADPPELDVEELLDHVEAAVLARPDEAWRLTVRAAERRRILACVPMPALGWSAIEVVAGGGAEATSPEPVADAVTAGERRLDNGLVAIEVDDDGTFRMEGGGVKLRGCRADRRRRGPG